MNFPAVVTVAATIVGISAYLSKMAHINASKQIPGGSHRFDHDKRSDIHYDRAISNRGDNLHAIEHERNRKIWRQGITVMPRRREKGHLI